MRLGALRVWGAVAAIAITTLAIGCSGSASSTTGGSPAETLARQKCSMCHTYDRVAQAKKDAAGWAVTIDRMVRNGLVVTAEERAQVQGYLIERDK